MTMPMPPDPLTMLATTAAAQHEVFMAWVSAGFTRAEALQMLTATILQGLFAATAEGQADADE